MSENKETVPSSVDESIDVAENPAAETEAAHDSHHHEVGLS